MNRHARRAAARRERPGGRVSAPGGVQSGGLTISDATVNTGGGDIVGRDKKIGLDEKEVGRRIDEALTARLARSGVLFSTTLEVSEVMIQLGPRGPTFGWNKGDYSLKTHPSAERFLPYLKESHFKVEIVEGQMTVSTQIRDRHGNLAAELVRNEWTVAPPPITYEKNYSANALEVRGAEGDVIL